MALSMQVTVLCRCEYLDSWHQRGKSTGLAGGGEAWARGERGEGTVQGGVLWLCGVVRAESTRAWSACPSGPPCVVLGVALLLLWLLMWSRGPAAAPAGCPDRCLPSPRPLHIAARNGLAAVVQALLSRGATVLAVDEEGACPPWAAGSREVSRGAGAARRGARLARGGFPIPSAAELHVPSLETWFPCHHPREKCFQVPRGFQIPLLPPCILVAVGLACQVWAGTKPALAEPLISD